MKLTEVDSYPVIMQESISHLSKWALKYLGVKDHDVCHLSSKSSEKKIVRVWGGDRDQMIRQMG